MVRFDKAWKLMTPKDEWTDNERLFIDNRDHITPTGLNEF